MLNDCSDIWKPFYSRSEQGERQLQFQSLGLLKFYLSDCYNWSLSLVSISSLALQLSTLGWAHFFDDSDICSMSDYTETRLNKNDCDCIDVSFYLLTHYIFEARWNVF